MNNYQKAQAIAIPNFLFELPLEDNLKYALIKLLSFNQEYIPIELLIENKKISRNDLIILQEKNYINICENQLKIVVDMKPLFTENTNSNNLSTKEVISADMIDRINYVLGKNITSLELEQMKDWLKSGFNSDDIELAIHKSVLKNITNFNYIQTVLYNSSKINKTNPEKIQRNINLY